MSDVFFIKAENRGEYLSKMRKGMEKAGGEMFSKDALTAVKLHFGEMGNTAYIKPVYVNSICRFIEEYGSKPFLTDTNTLYRGQRSNSVDHLKNAAFNGFSYYPVIIGDGLRGRSCETVEINGEILKEVYIGSELFHSDAIVFISHFKGHQLSGFGGAIKNAGMGCACRAGKLVMHSKVNPRVYEEQCIGCMVCATWCQVKAISKKGTKAFIDPEICTGCGLCIDPCPKGAIRIKWDMASSDMQKRMAEYALGAIKNKKVLFINFVSDITPECDCFPSSDAPIAQDVGIIISNDPVAADRASYDLINEKAGHDVFKHTHESSDPEAQLLHGEKIGLGSNEYKLITL